MTGTVGRSSAAGRRECGVWEGGFAIEAGGRIR
jgi:hypothetical protein